MGAWKLKEIGKFDGLCCVDFVGRRESVSCFGFLKLNGIEPSTMVDAR